MSVRTEPNHQPQIVVRFNPYSHKSAWRKSLQTKAPLFHYASVWLISSQYGNGNNETSLDQTATSYFSTSAVASFAIVQNRNVPAISSEKFVSNPQNLTNLQPMRSRSWGESLIVCLYSPNCFAIISARSGLTLCNRSIKASRTNSRCLYLPLTPAVIPMLTAKNNRLLISSSKRSCPISLEAAVRGRMVLIKLIGRSPNTSWCSCIASSLGVILELLLKKPILPLISQSSCARKPEVLCAMRPGLNRDFSARRDRFQLSDRVP